MAQAREHSSLNGAATALDASLPGLVVAVLLPAARRLASTASLGCTNAEIGVT